MTYINVIGQCSSIVYSVLNLNIVARNIGISRKIYYFPLSSFALETAYTCPEYLF